MLVKEPKNPSRTARAGLVFVNRLLTQGAGLVVTFLITPLIIGKLGEELYGALRIIQRSTDFLSLGHLRPMSVLKLTLARSIGETDPLVKRRQCGAALLVWVLMLPLLIVLGGAATWYSPSLFHISPGLEETVRQAMAVAAVVVAITPAVGLPMSVLKGLNLEYLVLGVNGVAAILAAGVTYLAVSADFSLPWVVAALSSQMVLTVTVNYHVVRRHVPWFGLARPPWAQVRDFLGLNLWNLGRTFLRYVYQAGDVVLIGLVFGAKAGATFALVSAVMTRLTDPLVDIFQAGLPGVGDLLGRGETRRVAALRFEMIRAMLTAATVVGIGVILLNKPFLHLWITPEDDGGMLLGIMVVVMVIVDLLTRIESIFLESALALRSQTYALLGATGLYLVTFVLLAPVLGLASLPAAKVLAQGVLLLTYWIPMRRILDATYWEVASPLFRPLLPVILLLGAAIFAIGWLQPVTWVALFTDASLVFVFVVAAGWWLILCGEDRIRLRQRIVRMMGKRA